VSKNINKKVEQTLVEFHANPRQIVRDTLSEIDAFIDELFNDNDPRFKEIVVSVTMGLHLLKKRLRKRFICPYCAEHGIMIHGKCINCNQRQN
jgi:hypothetical protein